MGGARGGMVKHKPPIKKWTTDFPFLKETSPHHHYQDETLVIRSDRLDSLKNILFQNNFLFLIPNFKAISKTNGFLFVG